MGRSDVGTRRAGTALRKFALGYPEAYEEFPWGELAIKVRKRVFVFMSAGGDPFSISVKLPRSAEAALMLPFAEPTHYGLGRSGWVTSRFSPGTNPPLEILREWIDESYRAIAPRKLVARLPGVPSIPRPPARSRRSGTHRAPRPKRARK